MTAARISSSDDATLVCESLTGKRGSFDSLVEKYHGMVYAIAFARLPNRETAQDLTQEVFLRVHLNLDRLKHPRYFSAWISTIARNLAINWAEKDQRSSRLISSIPLEDLKEKIPDSSKEEIREKMMVEEEQRTVQKAIMRLSPELREIVLLHYKEDWSTREIAKRLGVHPTTVGRQLQKALGSLKKYLDPQIRKGVFAFRPPKKSVARTIAIIGAVSSMSAASKAALAAAAGGVGQLSAGAATKTGFVSYVLGYLPSFAIKGGIAVGVKKAALIVVIAASVIGGGIYTVTKMEKKEEKTMPTSINMPAPASDSGNIYARGMSAILSHLGTKLSYDQVMGLSGVAFILQMDTSGPYLSSGELDCAWWPNDDWGFELGLPVLAKASGWEISKLSADFDAYKANPEAVFRRDFSSAIEESLRAGKPVLSYGFVCTAMDKQQPPLLGYGTEGKSAQYGQSKTRIERYPWHLYVIGNRIPAGNPTDVDLASLRHIIALFNEQARGSNTPETRLSGKQAWIEWLRLLRARQGCDNNMLIHLRYNRRSAVAYLREMAQRHTGATGKRLSSAADIYQSIVDEAMKQGMPYNRVQSGEDYETVNADYTAMVERISKMEAQAIAELTAAAASF